MKSKYNVALNILIWNPKPKGEIKVKVKLNIGQNGIVIVSLEGVSCILS